MSLLSRLQLAAIAFCSKDDSRTNIKCLHLTDRTVEATNGWIAVQVTRTDDLKEDDFPNIMPTAVDGPVDTLIARDAAAKALAAIPKRGSLPILNHARVLMDAQGNTLLGTTDLESPQVLTLKPVDGTFPSFDQVVPKKEDGKFSIGLDPRLLLELCKYAAQFSDRNSFCRDVEFTFYDSDKPVRIDWKNEDHAAIAIVMPMRIENAKPMPFFVAEKGI